MQPLENANAHSLVWISPTKPDKLEIIATTLASVIICDESLDFEKIKTTNKCFIVVENPKLVFLRIVSAYFIDKIERSIHPTSTLHSEAITGSNIHIGPNCYIGKCTLGDNVTIMGNNFLYDNVIIGNNVTINAGSVIGADGFGYAKNDEGQFEKFPHIGGVVIEDNVEIGANTCIDKGTLGNTIIKRGAKIDNLVHIAHNVTVGENSMIIALAMIGGSTIIGDNVWVAPSSSLRDRIEIGKNAVIGMGAVITKSVPEKEVWLGNPGKNKNLL
ncbi:MAG: UDP-3-O-(3-hydroxymyristoyl)glucosamine N-acyltransferase [Bacteroidetes bacterium]|nr:UDP-3-O-(3-hydroxymyristoyl)glucosamine N-acyltransferase [Bacteroidota bacterium]